MIMREGESCSLSKSFTSTSIATCTVGTDDLTDPQLYVGC